MVASPGPFLCNASKELGVLLRLVARYSLPSAQDAPAIPVPDGFDWERLFVLADRHGLYPQLSEAVLTGGLAPCPMDASQSLKSGWRMRQLVNVVLERQLVEIMTELRRAGLTATALKGPVLDWHFYPGARLRQYSDIDVWVAPRQVGDAVRLLRKLGFSTEVDVADPPRHPALRNSGEMVFTRRGAPDVDVDLHWRLFARSHRDCPALAGFERRLQCVTIGSDRIPTLGDEDLLVYLCHHATKHGMSKLAYVQEISLQLARSSDAVVRNLVDVARREGRGLAFALGPYLAAHVAGTRVPQAIEDAVDAMAQRDHILSHLVSHWEDTAPVSDGSRQLRPILAPSLAARIRAVAVEIAIPRVADWRAFPLDGRWAEIYYVLRPLRLLARAVGAGARSLSTRPAIRSRKG